MGLVNWLMHRSMSKEAARLARIVQSSYAESKARNPSASDSEIIRGMAFDENAVRAMPEASRQRMMTCCETIQGFCYMMALDIGKFKGSMNFRSLQFTRYMDDALRAEGFPLQSKEQKACVLEAMGLKIDGWERFSKD